MIATISEHLADRLEHACEKHNDKIVTKHSAGPFPRGDIQSRKGCLLHLIRQSHVHPESRRWNSIPLYTTVFRLWVKYT